MRVRLIAVLVLAFAALLPAAGASQAAPDAGSICASTATTNATCTTVMDAVVALIPPPPAILAMVRLTFNSGAEFSRIYAPGPTLLLVERGVLTVDMFG